MNDREVAGVRRAITWLFERARKMNDPHATQVLNSAADNLGHALRRWREGRPREADRQTGEERGE
jgi:hypothetical protein